MNSSPTRLEIPGFQVMEYLGTGARSTIWRVRERRTGRQCALKRVNRLPGDDGRFLDQAFNEYHVANHFDHPAIRKYYRLRRIRRWFKLTELQLLMEVCDGVSCQANRPTGLEEVARIFLAVAQGLAHMHARGFVHADIKPNNIIVAGDGAVKLIDFGQSCPIGTIKERIQGTPDFIAPEQVYLRPLDGRTDLFNLGAALYWVLTGQAIPTVLPKKSDGILLLSDLHVAPPEQLNPAVPPPLGRLVLDCIEPQPSRRPGSARDVIARLDLIGHMLAKGDGAGPPG